MTFEVFTRPRAGTKTKTDQPSISTDRTRRTLRFNAAALPLLGQTEAVRILVDRDTGTIAFELAVPKTDPDSWSLARAVSSAWLNCARLITDRDLPASNRWPLTITGNRLTFRPPEIPYCTEPVWDGPYKMQCGYNMPRGTCVRHRRGGMTSADQPIVVHDVDD